MAYNFRKEAAKATPTSISDGKVKFSMRDIMETYPNGISVNAFEIAEGRNGDFAVCCFAENDSAYFFGGKALTRICKHWLEDFSSAAECSAELKASGGVPMTFKRKTLEDGRDYITVTVL